MNFRSFPNPVATGRPAHANACKCGLCKAWRNGDRKMQELLTPPKNGRLAIDTMPLPLKPPGGRP